MTLNVYKKCTVKPYYILATDTTVAPGNPLRFRKNKKLIMKADDKIRDEKLRYDINREGTQILALSSRKNDKYEYQAVEEILLLN